jgi:hypothetical protein
MMRLCYRSADDAFVILDDAGTPIAETSASDMLARKTRDPEAAKVGILRFLDFKDWQTKSCGKVLWSSGAEDAMARAERL